MDLPPYLRTRAITNSSVLLIRCSTDVRNDTICEDPTLPHLDFLADSQKCGNQGEGNFTGTSCSCPSSRTRPSNSQRQSKYRPSMTSGQPKCMPGFTNTGPFRPPSAVVLRRRRSTTSACIKLLPGQGSPELTWRAIFQSAMRMLLVLMFECDGQVANGRCCIRLRHEGIRCE
jgi:hypothetical protein